MSMQLNEFGGSLRWGRARLATVASLVVLGVAACSGADSGGLAEESERADTAAEASETTVSDAGTDTTDHPDGVDATDDAGTDDDAETGAAAPAVAEPIDDDAWWETSLCSELDLATLQADSGLGSLERQLGNGFALGVPPVRECSVGEGDSATGGQRLQIGMSLLPVDEAGWQQVVDHEKSLAEDPEEVQSVGDHAFITPSLGKALVGDRVVSVDTMDVSALTAEQLEAVLQDVAAVAAETEGPDTQQAIEGCAAGDEAAATLLGEQPAVRADFYHPAFETPTCVWATDSTGVLVWARPVDDAASEQEGQGYDETVDLGRGGGMYLEDGSAFVLSWASEDNAHDVTMEFVDGQEVDPADAEALGAALEGLYGSG